MKLNLTEEFKWPSFCSEWRKVDRRPKSGRTVDRQNPGLLLQRRSQNDAASGERSRTNERERHRRTPQVYQRRGRNSEASEREGGQASSTETEKGDCGFINDDLKMYSDAYFQFFIL